MKISIISDLEGVSGSVWGGYGLPMSGEAGYYTEMMTAEINAVVRTLLAAGVDDIYLYEAHTVKPGVLPPGITRGSSMDQLAGSAALFFVGQHGPAGVRKAVFAHTMSSATTARVTLNGMVCGELTMCAAYAGVLGIPTVFVSGEYQTGREAARNLPGPFEFVCDEIGLSNHSAICRPFTSLEPELAAQTRKALAHIGKTKPFNIGRITLKIRKRYQGMGEKAAQLPFVRRDGDWLVIEAPDMVKAFRLYLIAALGREFWSFKLSK